VPQVFAFVFEVRMAAMAPVEKLYARIRYFLIGLAQPTLVKIRHFLLLDPSDKSASRVSKYTHTILQDKTHLTEAHLDVFGDFYEIGPCRPITCSSFATFHLDDKNFVQATSSDFHQ
jgi:hypothetical protein